MRAPGPASSLAHQRGGAVRRAVPGLLACGAGAVVALAAAAPWAALSVLPVAVLVGAVGGNLTPPSPRLGPGLAVAKGPLLRVAVVLLGFRLVVDDALGLGVTTLGLVLAVATVAFAGTLLLGRLLGLRREVALLTGTGFAICGASAIAAAQGTVRAEEEDVGAALGLVLLFGSLSIVLLPAVAGALDLPASVAGVWVGAAVHDVGQAVAAAELIGDRALEVAMVVKLARVLLLGPVLLLLAVLVRRARSPEAPRTDRIRQGVPLFVIGFVGAVVLRSLEVLPTPVVAALATLERVGFALALVALGAEIRVARLRTLGWRPALLGSAAYVLVAGVALAGALLVR